MWCTRIVSIAFHLKSLESHKIWNLLGHIVADARMEKSQPLKQYRKPYFHFVMKRKSSSLRNAKEVANSVKKWSQNLLPECIGMHDTRALKPLKSLTAGLSFKKLDERMPLKGSLTFLKASLRSLFTTFNRKSKFWISSKISGKITLQKTLCIRLEEKWLRNAFEFYNWKVSKFQLSGVLGLGQDLCGVFPFLYRSSSTFHVHFFLKFWRLRKPWGLIVFSLV